jgi:uncharacterized protein YecE (DUF72 family)
VEVVVALLLVLEAQLLLEQAAALAQFDDVMVEAVEPLRELAGQSQEAYAFFNNNASSEDPDNPLGRVSQAATNARQLRRLLDMNGITASGGA